MSQPITLYVDAALLTDNGSDPLSVAAEVGLMAVVVDDITLVPEDLTDAWHLAAELPVHGSPRWSRTVVVGPRVDPGRRSVTGLRTARDLRLAILELASEHASD